MKYTQCSSWFIFPAIGSYRSLHDYSRMAGYSRFWNCSNSAMQGNLFQFFIKPELKIVYDPISRLSEHVSQNTDERWGTLKDFEDIWAAHYKLPPIFYPERRFINIVVENNGRGLA